MVNPAYRRLEGEIKKQAAILSRRKAQFHDLQNHDTYLTPKKMATWEQKKAEIGEEIEFIEKKLSDLKTKRKQTPKHIAFEALDDEDRFQRIAPARKQLLDTVKMIAYRAETSMAQVLREYLGRMDDARPLLRQIYSSDVDLVPDEANKVLTVRLHSLPTHNQMMRWQYYVNV